MTPYPAPWLRGADGTLDMVVVRGSKEGTRRARKGTEGTTGSGRAGERVLKSQAGC